MLNFNLYFCCSILTVSDCICAKCLSKLKCNLNCLFHRVPTTLQNVESWGNFTTLENEGNFALTLGDLSFVVDILWGITLDANWFKPVLFCCDLLYNNYVVWLVIFHWMGQNDLVLLTPFKPLCWMHSEYTLRLLILLSLVLYSFRTNVFLLYICLFPINSIRFSMQLFL